MGDINTKRVAVVAAILGVMLVVLYLGASWQMERQHAERAVVYQELCDQGSAENCFEIANVTMRGRGIEQDLARARELFRKSCDMGYIMACNDLGWSYQHPMQDGFPQEYDRAAEYYREACDGDVMMACANLAGLHFFGHGMPEDQQRAVELTEKTCDGDYAEGCYAMGSAYMEGIGGLSPNAAKAADFFEKACELDPDFC